jgi:DNA replication protein DnaC
MQIVKKQEIVKQEIMRQCKTCAGYGCRDCASNVERVNVMANAGIPVEYWMYSLDNFNGDNEYKNKINELASNIHTIYTNGSILVFTGSLGVGKTFGACELLKAGLFNGLTGKFTTLTEMIDNILNKGESYKFKAELLNYDVLIIDEVDTRHIPLSKNAQDIFGDNLEYILRTRKQNKLPTIFCSNNDDLSNTFDGVFGQVFSSLFASNIIHIPVRGKDLRK